MRMLPLLCAVAITIALSACDQNKKDEKVTVTTPGGNVTVSGGNGNFTMKSSDGKSSVEIASNGGASTDKVPGFVSVYPGSTVVSTVIGAEAAGGGGMVIYTTKAAPDEVIAFHKKNAEGAGLAETMNMTTQGSMSFTATDKASKRTVQVTVTKSDDGTTQAQAVWSSGGD
jgi:hypothetical protein